MAVNACLHLFFKPVDDLPEGPPTPALVRALAGLREGLRRCLELDSR